MSNTFDPNTFLSQRTSEQAKRRPPLPAGTELLGVIGENFAVRSYPNKKNPGAPDYIFLDVPIRLDLSTRPDLVKQQGTDNLTMTHSVGLDYTSEGALDWSVGRNGGLRIYREALNLNQPGQSFGIPDLTGRPIKAKISHRTNNNEIYDQIDSVAKP